MNNAGQPASTRVGGCPLRPQVFFFQEKTMSYADEMRRKDRLEALVRALQVVRKEAKELETIPEYSYANIELKDHFGATLMEMGLLLQRSGLTTTVKVADEEYRPPEEN
jgi:hypothetical protein